MPPTACPRTSTGRVKHFYGTPEGHRFLYSQSLDSWLYYVVGAKNFHVYRDDSRIDHKGVTAPSFFTKKTEQEILGGIFD